MLKKSAMNWSVKQLVKMQEKGKINFNISIQRNANVWDISRKSLLIHSIIEGYPIPPMFAIEHDGIYSMLDGKQRLTSTCQFVDNEFALQEVPVIHVGLETIKQLEEQQRMKIQDDETTEEQFKTVETNTEMQNNENNEELFELDINGMKFTDLPEEIRDDILSQIYTIYKFENVTDEQVEEMFIRLNNGVPLTNFELTRVKLGKLMEFITKLTVTELFQKIKLSNKQLNRYVDQEIALQIFALLYSEDIPSLAIKDLKLFAEDFDMTEEQKEDIMKITEFIDKSLITTNEKIYSKFMKKVHIPIIYYTAKKLMNKISPDEFGKRVVQFFTIKNKPTGTKYNDASRSGSAKKENVRTRINEMMEDVSKEI